MTVTWILIASITVSALLLLAMLFGPFRFARTGTDPAEGRSRDWTGRLGAAAPVIAALIVGVFGIVTAELFIASQDDRVVRDRQQVAAQDKARERREQMQRRLDTVERFLPLLSKGEQERSNAILAVRATGDTELAAMLAGLFPSPGSVSALETIARRDAPQDWGPSVTALAAMNTAESRAALTRVYDDHIRALVAFDCEGGGHAQQVIAGVVWNDQWLLVPLGNFANASPRSIAHAEQRGRQSFGDGLTRFHFAKPPAPAASLTSIQFSTVIPERDESVFAIGLDSEGHPNDPRLGVVASVDADAVVVRFAHAPEQVAGSLLVLPSGQAVGMLSHEQHQTSTFRYIRSDVIMSWFQQLEREEHDRQRRK